MEILTTVIFNKRTESAKVGWSNVTSITYDELGHPGNIESVLITKEDGSFNRVYDIDEVIGYEPDPDQ